MEEWGIGWLALFDPQCVHLFKGCAQSVSALLRAVKLSQAFFDSAKYAGSGLKSQKSRSENRCAGISQTVYAYLLCN